MKCSCKTLLLSIGILSLSLSACYATNEADTLSSDANYQIQPNSINDLIYILIVRGPEKWFYPTFEFEAGNSLRVIGASEEYGELTGIWQEVEFPAFSFVQAQVEEIETATTTTTTALPTRNLMSDRFEITEEVKFLIDLWGISFASLPPPFSSIGMLMGAGAYLGENVIFIGFTGTPGEEPTFGSITPVTGSRESTVNCTITCFNTTFRDDPPVNVTFSPATDEELKVSNISVVSNTEIEFDLAISVDAPLEQNVVTVTWGEPLKTVSSADVGKFFVVTD